MANNPTPITSLTLNNNVKGTDVYPAVDVDDFTQSPNGTTYKYTVNDLANFIVENLGFSSYPQCQVATLSNLTALYNNGVAGVGATLTNSGALAALTIDNVVATANMRILVKNQTNNAENGIYIVTNAGSSSIAWILTRATFFNSATNIVDNCSVFF